MENNGITKADVEARRADLRAQHARAVQEIAAADAKMRAIDGAIQENDYYLKVFADRDKPKPEGTDGL